jgi:hypothetical protein
MLEEKKRDERKDVRVSKKRGENKNLELIVYTKIK